MSPLNSTPRTPPYSPDAACRPLIPAQQHASLPHEPVLPTRLPASNAPLTQDALRAPHLQTERRAAPQLPPPMLGHLDASLVKLLQDLIATPSVNNKDPEIHVIRCLTRFLDERDVPYDLFTGETDRPVLRVSAGPQDVPGLLIIAHTDTVPVGNRSDWQTEPFDAVIEDGKLYGRGACDCKGGLVAGLAAVLAARDMPKLQLPISLVCVPDEEAGATGRLGINVLKAAGQLTGLGAIYAYPGLDKIQVGHRGIWRFAVTVKGHTMHTGTQQWQDSSKTNNALTAISDLALQFEALANQLSEKQGDGLFKPYRTVLTPVTSSAGSCYGQVPATAHMQVDVRLLPNTDLLAVKQAVNHVLCGIQARRPELEWTLTEEYYINPTLIAEDSAIVTALRQACLTVLGKQPPLAVSGPANESYLLNAAGIPTAVLGPIGGAFHEANEYVQVDSIATAANIYTATLRQLEALAPRRTVSNGAAALD